MPTEVLIELGQVEGNQIKGMQLMPLGEWKHPQGPIKITPERARKFAQQFARKVAGQDLPILYIHSDKQNTANPLYGQAAGWITNVYADDKRGVLIDAEFTDDGAQAVNSKKYRYLSAEYFDKVQLAHHQAPEEDVLVGASLVNRPHLKGMDPILNEETGHQFYRAGEANPAKPEGGDPVDPILTQLCEVAGIEFSEDQTELTEEQRTALTTHLTSQTNELKKIKTERDSLKKQLDEKDPESSRQKSLAEAGFEQEATLLAEYRADKLVRQMEEAVGEGHALTKPFIEKVREHGLTQSQSSLQEALELALAGNATVELGERGSSGPGKEGASDKTPDIQLDALAKEKMKEMGDNADYFKALSEVQAENPELFAEYQRSFGSKAGAS
jgi:phage I-like protein